MERHPYYPPTALIPDFTPNTSSMMSLLPMFGIVVSTVVFSALRQAKQSQFCVRPVDRFAAAWFALCGFLHVAFEGYYIYYRGSLVGMDTPFAQLWKEYALSDSRYLTSDIFTVCVETITVFVWGPLCWLTFISILRNAPTRHFLQVMVSTAHLYGVTLYYATNWMESRSSGVSYSRPEFLYFWVYYVGFNLPWAVVPLGLLLDSFRQTGRAFVALGEKEANKKSK